MALRLRPEGPVPFVQLAAYLVIGEPQEPGHLDCLPENWLQPGNPRRSSRADLSEPSIKLAVSRACSGRNTEASEPLYFRLFKSQLAVIVRCRSTPLLNSSFGSSCALCTRVHRIAAPPGVPPLACSLALVQPISCSCCFGTRVRFSKKRFPDSRKAYCVMAIHEEIIERFHLLQAPILPRPHFTRYRPRSDLARDKQGRLRLGSVVSAAAG